MDIGKAMLEEFADETALTRSLLNVVPDDLLSFQAGETMHTVQWNVSHLADIPSWMEVILKANEFDVAPPGEPPHDTVLLGSASEALSVFDKNVAGAVACIESLDVETLEQPWTLKAGGHPLMTMTRFAAFRKYQLNHVAHHRGHLLVYLRLNGIETPLLYGG